MIQLNVEEVLGLNFRTPDAGQLEHSVERTRKVLEPVSQMTLKAWKGVPIWISPRYARLYLFSMSAIVYLSTAPLGINQLPIVYNRLWLLFCVA